jgi:glycogen debranching enzyme
MAHDGPGTDVIWELPPELFEQIEQILMNQGKRKGPVTNGALGIKIVKDPYYILAPSPLADDRTRVLKQGDTFAVFDSHGDIRPVGLGEEGLYHEGTRFLSCLQFKLGDARPLILSSAVKDDNELLTVDLTNPDIYVNGRVIIPRGTVHLFRSKFLWEGNCFERLQIRNYGLGPVELSFTLEFLADFADIFEVRGTKRRKRGELLPVERQHGRLVLAYLGLDGVVRRTILEFAPPPTKITDQTVFYQVPLDRQGEASFLVTVTCESQEAATPHVAYESAVNLVTAAVQQARGECCQIHTSNEQFNDWLNRSLADLHMMVTDTPEGPYPYAGVPWFSTAFGRDGIITALEALWVNPALARGVLRYLAAHQAEEVNPDQDAEPGKILHETRKGEMAALGEIPFRCYYGSVDATPLFVLLTGAYYERTGDRELLDRLWPHVERALHWMDAYGDRDGDGFVEYDRRSPKGLVHQGWKDSQNSIFHADGAPAEPPIALCEVQGYVYAARRAAALLAAVRGDAERSAQLNQQARELQERFEQAFWCEELSTYALALDGRKRPCRVRSSNAGQCLFTGIVSPERARCVMETLTGTDSFSGWGIRTIASSEAHYNPMSYHNGSVWPHDNALIALGFDRYQHKHAVLQVLTGLFDASLFVDWHRMPELFCGFSRRPGEGPTRYPVACAPQAWAAATPFLLLQSALGMDVRGVENKVAFAYPQLPGFLNHLWIRNLRVGAGLLDLRVERHRQGVGIEVLRREGDVRVTSVK